MTAVKWPKCPQFYAWCEKHHDAILHGTLVSIDPATGHSSPPGFAVFYGGELQTKGTIDLPKSKNVYERLQALAEKVAIITPEPPDVVLVEMIIKGMANQSLLWSVGTILGSARTPLCEQVPIAVWKAVAATMPGYVKGDAADAEMMGLAAILRAQLF